MKSSSARGRSIAATVSTVAAIAVCALLMAGGAAWRLTGGDWAVIATPSMGTAAPVGTLILTRERPLASIEVGDIVTYRPPSGPDRLYTHRVVRVLPDGRLEMRGDINGAVDPWPVGERDLVGVVVARWIGVGWAVRALPMILLSGLVLLVATRSYAPPTWRSSLRVLGWCLILAIASLIQRPFVHPILLGVTDRGSGPMASVVSAGVFPTRIRGGEGAYVDLRAGETATIPVAAVRPGGPVMIDATPHLTGPWLLCFVAASLLPMAWCVLVGLSPTTDDPSGERANARRRNKGDAAPDEEVAAAARPAGQNPRVAP